MDLISSKDLIVFVFVDFFISIRFQCLLFEVSARRPIDRPRAVSSDIFGLAYKGHSCY